MVNPDSSSSNAKTPLHRMISLIAHNPELDMVVPDILQEIVGAADASSGFFIITDEPHAVFLRGIEEADIPDEEAFTGIMSSISAGFHSELAIPESLQKYGSRWLVAPILYKKRVVALLGILHSHTAIDQEKISGQLMPLVDCLTIVTHSARSEARHIKQTQNQNEFVRIVSHDLRSPLTSIKGFASMLESNPTGEWSEKQLHFVEKILTGVTQMTSLVDNIQDAGRYDPETGFYEMERTPTDLVEMVQSIVRNHLVPAEKQELSMVVSATDDIPIVSVDPIMLERSVTNLVDNAIKYTPNGGRIVVGVKKAQNAIVITVTDNGYGISEEHIRHLFQRHYRIRRREHKRVKGIGLGLFIVRSVARHHGGDAFVESVEGEGATFGIRIPLVGENLLGGSEASEA